ncbi:ribosomal biogenesis protein LAS1L-like [Tubulanus polymorphus]|uniref:ribosomal biogenesis protein LAS1L-like n=1 Tax=Tubulanus polymorphus TaxID=672921 RepID=UPI003DA2584B
MEYRIVGWFDSNEWNQVYNELFSKSKSKRKHALRRIDVWKSRMINKLSASIECTALLIQAVLDDEESSSESENRSAVDTKLRMNYSMALIRFVNAMTETLQNREYAQPVHKIAESMGLPEWLVELRHQASHSALPSLEILRCGAEFSLNWLKAEYWESHLDSTQGIELTPHQKQELSFRLEDTFVIYMQEQYEVCDYQAKNITLSSTDRQRIRTSLEEMERLVSIDCELAIDVIMQDGYLTPTVEQLSALGIDVDELISSENPSLPQKVKKIWIPTLKVLNKLEMIQALVESILKVIPMSTGLRLILLNGWIDEILYALNNHANGKREKILPIFQCLDWNVLTKYVDVDSEQNSLFQRILEVSNLSEAQKSTVMKLTDIYTNTGPQRTPRQPSDDDHRIYTIHDFTELSSKNTKKENNSKKIDIHAVTSCPVTSPWQRCNNNTDWSQYPIGSAPDVSVTYRNMELWQDEDYNSSSSSEEDEEHITEDLEDMSYMCSVNDISRTSRRFTRERIEEILSKVTPL